LTTTQQTVLVTGATGQQGGAATRHLLASGWQVRALTRDPGQPAARRLATAGVELVQGDLGDRAAIEQAVRDVYGVFSVQNPQEHGPEAETAQGIALADAAKAANVQHFVYTSAGGAERNSGLPHVESKWAIEQHIHALGLPATILRPVFFMENFNWSRQAIADGVFTIALHPHTRLQMIAADDIGAFVALAFNNPAQYIDKALELAGDELPPTEIARVFGHVLQRTVAFVEQPIEQVRSVAPEMALMFEWFNSQGNQADLSTLRTLHPQLMSLEQWVRANRWTPAAA
jgi:uncharacterized protein YbjT (DUF2867 family)